MNPTSSPSHPKAGGKWEGWVPLGWPESWDNPPEVAGLVRGQGASCSAPQWSPCEVDVSLCPLSYDQGRPCSQGRMATHFQCAPRSPGVHFEEGPGCKTAVSPTTGHPGGGPPWRHSGLASLASEILGWHTAPPCSPRAPIGGAARGRGTDAGVGSTHLALPLHSSFWTSWGGVGGSSLQL